ncbi:MAG: putative LPS assembly protein LptD [Candidatus Marinimicrobia bacterium]|nr:putative LPS assembly protein LptD [Candidatus Neomarinimicrobiota bacterium]
MKTEKEPLYVKNGVFSTCELDEPHFCLEAKRMKVIPGDRVFAQDIVFKVLDVPLMYFPSIFVPIEEGERRSGWILPHFGRYANKGWALEGSGYYWAPNDYYDARILLDFYDNYGISTELRQRYAWRHHISNGHLTLKYWNYFLSRDPSQGYKISINHPQTIGQRSSLHISGSYTNDAKHFTRELDKDERLEQQMVSRATFQTSLGPFGINLNASRTQDLLTGNSTTYLPQFSLSRSPAKIFKRKSLNDPEKWYHNFTYSLNSTLSNRMTHTFDRVDSLFNDEVKNKFQTNAGIRYNDKLFGFLTISPYLNYSEDWTTLYKKPRMNASGDSALVDSSGELLLKEVSGFKRRGRFDLGSRASTTLYGVFNINIWRLKAVRHTVNMSLNYRYRPDQSDNPDYVFRGIGTNGEPQSYDYFESTLLGKTPDSENQTFNMSFNHNVETKTLGRDGNEKKTHILNVRHSYDFLADSLRSSLITASSTIKDLPGGMSLKMDASFDPYAYTVDENSGNIDRIDKLTIPRITSFKAGTDILVKPKKGSITEKDADSLQNNAMNTALAPVKGADAGFSDWQFTAGLWFTSSASNPLNVKNRLLINTNLKAQLTPKWSGSYQINIDVLEQKITDQRIRLTRDLHCWTLSLDWNPGYSFFIRLNAKSSLLKDLKLEKRSGKYY